MNFHKKESPHKTLLSSELANNFSEGGREIIRYGLYIVYDPEKNIIKV